MSNGGGAGGASAGAPPGGGGGSAESDGLPKRADLIKAEMGIVLQGTRHVLVVSLADDLEAVSTAWCAERGLGDKARAKIVAQLQTRLDAALAQAYQEHETQQQQARLLNAPVKHITQLRKLAGAVEHDKANRRTPRRRSTA